MLDQRLQRWPNIKTALVYRFVFSEDAYIAVQLAHFPQWSLYAI